MCFRCAKNKHGWDKSSVPWQSTAFELKSATRIARTPEDNRVRIKSQRLLDGARLARIDFSYVTNKSLKWSGNRHYKYSESLCNALTTLCRASVTLYCDRHRTLT